MSTGHLFLKPPIGEQKRVSEDSKASIDQQNGKPKKERGKEKKNGRGGNEFRIAKNTIKGSKSDRVGIFGFGNTHMCKKSHGKEEQVESSEETDSASSSEEDEEAVN
ncbi:unnamed protein product [Prunus armeniaca]|uniref:Uncharacterized protein n=1 Tax=Prunus armeniaca TaxID=36596 RepID=A0A6J5TV87_PRUAR|nr:unnamed protein product [Prunus armeniaca]CAB4298442.1 unnamed protein product [Prunus armeniaca]